MQNRETMTIRMPRALAANARRTKSPDESLNDFLVSAVAREVRRRHALETHDRIVKTAERIRARTGVQPSSVPLIRALREGVGRRG